MLLGKPTHRVDGDGEKQGFPLFLGSKLLTGRNGHRDPVASNYTPGLSPYLIARSCHSLRSTGFDSSRHSSLPTQVQRPYRFSRKRKLNSVIGDPLLRSLDTTVVSCNVVKPPPGDKSKKSAKKAVSAPVLPDETMLHVQLHDTVIFPEGGGQPTDIGTVTIKADASCWQVLQAKRHGGHAVHYIRIKDGDEEAAIRAFSPGVEVTVALGEEGYERRYDHVCCVFAFPTRLLICLCGRCRCIHRSICYLPC